MNRAVRQVPWGSLIKFHKEICRRAEESFFSLSAGDSNSERWSSFDRFEPADLIGPWELPVSALISEQFLSRIRADDSLEILLGGPSWFAWKKKDGGDWYLDWRPVLYREVRAELVGDTIRLVPQSGNWDISPLVFELLEKRQVSTATPLEDAMVQILENIRRLQQSDGKSATASASETLAAYSSELGEELRKAQRDFPREKVKRVPSQWALFSPPRAGSATAYTQYILKDYGKLERLFEDAPQEVGGLGLLTDDHSVSAVTPGEILPIVPLNPSQFKAVDAVLKARPVTVISGPPGCGKSQVVLSLLLNAWSQGVSVLFASNNNQAVDVVRQRLETFENDIPIAVRAGAKRFSNIDDSLRRSLNLISSLEVSADGDQLARLQRKREELRRKREAKRTFLNSELPDRVDQAVGSSITSFATYKQLIGERDAQYSSLAEKLRSLGYQVVPEKFRDKVFRPLQSWVDELASICEQLTNDENQKNDCSQRIEMARQARDVSCARVGLNAAEVGSWSWLSENRQAPDLIENWWNTFKAFVLGTVDVDLQPVSWDQKYERWNDAVEAQKWGEVTTVLAEDIRSSIDILAATTNKVAESDELLKVATARLLAATGVESIQSDGKFIEDWLGAYAQLCSTPSGALDWLPWSARGKVLKTMSGIENALKKVIPLSVWKRVGPINDTSRNQLSEVLEVAKQWLAARAIVDHLEPDRRALSATFDGLRRRARECRFKVEQLPTGWDFAAWGQLAAEIEKMVAVSLVAADAWRRRTARDLAIARIQAAKREIHALSAGAPMKESWAMGLGAPLIQLLDQLADQPTTEILARVRAEVYEERPTALIESWRQAYSSEFDATEVERQRNEIPSRATRIRAWSKARPSIAAVKPERDDELPDEGSRIHTHLESCRVWDKKWSVFRTGSYEELSARADEEYRYALEMLLEAFDMVPGQLRSRTLVDYVETLKARKEADWDLARVRKGFEQFSPGRIRSDLEQIDAELQGVSFDAAKLEWQKRVATDSGLQDAMRDLRTHYQRNRGEIRDDGIALFERVLRGQPVWITTALSGQSIPLKAGLFDLVIIDEATQCTLTNLLPLIYRCKRLVVIGDPEQLPAIGSIGLGAERGLAEKYQVTDWLSLLGHADNDIYRASVSCLPRRQADVITLAEHYRSHPLIIGFSNQYIYRKSLQLRKDPTQTKDVTLGSGVVGINVAGNCVRVENSWLNGPERDAVVQLIRQLRDDPSGANLSIGVVTPFRSHANAIEKRLEQQELGRDVTVDTVHGYQGDERDVMIFSPVVAKGINPAAAIWVETPRNLINVAVTRARETLFFVADFNECRKQQGILGQFTRYSEKINLLRETSAEELQLFGWILMQGMMPDIHRMIKDVEVDFVLTNGGARPAIEVDGGQHNIATAQDAARDAFLVGAGYRVLRVKARDVRDAPAVVLARIGKALEIREDAWDFTRLEIVGSTTDMAVV